MGCAIWLRLRLLAAAVHTRRRHLLLLPSRDVAAMLAGTFGMIEHVFLVGVAGGVARCHDDLRRGDVIVSRPAQPGGAVYMQIASRDEYDSQSCSSWSARDPTLSDIARKLLRKPKAFFKQLDKHMADGLLPEFLFVSLLFHTFKMSFNLDEKN